MPSPRPRPTPRDGPSRREVLAAGAAAAATLGLARFARAEPEPAAGEDGALTPLPRRPFGRTGFQSTLFGLGCFPLGGLREDDAALAVVLRAIDLGCNYLDTAPSYGRGLSETQVGRALAARPDAEVFVATKTNTRTADEARGDLEGSLKRLGRSPIDLVQVHAVTDAEDLERALGPDGPLAALQKAKEEGLVRHIGVTGHADPEVMRRTFERWPFASILFPLNCVDPHHLSFEKAPLPAAVEKGLARVAMKAFASGNLVKQGIDVTACLRYVYALDVSTVIVGCRTPDEVDHAVRVVKDTRPWTATEKNELLRRTLPHKGKGVEWYKRA